MLAAALFVVACDDAVEPAPDPLIVQIVRPDPAFQPYNLDMIELLGSAVAGDIGVLPDDSVWWTVDGEEITRGHRAKVRVIEGERTYRFHARYGAREESTTRTITVRSEGLGRILWTVPLASNEADGLSMAGDGTLYAMDGYDAAVAITPAGSARWRLDLPVSNLANLSAVGPDGTLHYGHTGGAGTMGGVIAITPDGTIKWIFGTDSVGPPGSANYHVHGGVAVDGAGNVYFGSEESDAPMYALSADGELLWRTPTSPGVDNRFWSYTILVGDTIAVALQRQDSAVAVHTGSGAVRWKVPVSGQVFCQLAPAVNSDGRIWIPERSGDAVIELGVVTHSIDGDPSDGAPVLGPRGAYFATVDGQVRLLPAGVEDMEPSGESTFYHGGVTLGANGVVYVLGNDSLVSWDAAGQMRFSTRVPHTAVACSWAQGGPVIGTDGTVYVRASHLGIVAIRDTVGPAVDAAWPTFQGNFQRNGRRNIDP